MSGESTFGGSATVSAERECPCCLKERVCSVWEAERVFMTSGWGATSMLEDADYVCSYCHAVKIDGMWQRMETVDSRAYKLSQGGSKSSKEYREILTRGMDPGDQRDKPTVETEDW